MHKVASSVFRLTYTTLTEPTEVTANGQTIGTWVPGTRSASTGGLTEQYIVGAPPRVASGEDEAPFIRPNAAVPPTKSQRRPVERPKEPPSAIFGTYSPAEMAELEERAARLKGKR